MIDTDNCKQHRKTGELGWLIMPDMKL